MIDATGEVLDIGEDIRKPKSYDLDLVRQRKRKQTFTLARLASGRGRLLLDRLKLVLLARFLCGVGC